MAKPFQIYRSSAGSGKTYTLAKEYLLLALRLKSRYFQHILAVTFTNKATQEMKDRILGYLHDFASGKPHALAEELKAELKLDDRTFREQCADVQTQILHNYDQFSISTIDAFFQKVIRSFTREAGIMGDYRLEVEQDLVIEEVVDELIDELGENKELTDWVIAFAESNLEDNKSWDIRISLRDFAQEIFSEDFKHIEEDVLRVTQDKAFFSAWRNDVYAVRHAILSKQKKLAQEALQIWEASGLDAEDLYYSGEGLFSYLYNWADGTSLGKQKELGKRLMNEFCDVDKWPKKKSPNTTAVLAVAHKMVPLIQQLIEIHNTEYVKGITAEIILENLYVFGLIADISRKLKDYRDRNNLMLLADAPKFLNEVIDESETPFIYEKTGSFYRNFLIDEFQDTSSLQWKNFLPLIKNSLDQGYRCLVVGDVKQAIYRWRGGELKLLQDELVDQFGEALTNITELDKNFRSATEIVSFNNALFKTAAEQVTQLVDAKLPREAFAQVAQHNERAVPGFVSVSFIDTKDTEEKWKHIALQQLTSQLEQLQDAGVAMKDVAILVRVNSEGHEIAMHLLNYKNSEQANARYNYNVISNESLRLDGAASVNLLTAAMSFLLHADDKIARAQLSYEYHRLHHADLPLSEVFAVSSEATFDSYLPDGFTKAKLSLRKLPLFELTETLIQIFNLKSMQGELAYIQAFQDLVLDFYTRERNDLGAFLEWWEENKKSKSLQLSSAVDAAQIVTIHKSKGLQYKYVLIPFCSWKLDHDGYRAPLLWVQTKEKPFDRGGHMPVRYKSQVNKSLFADAYTQEKTSTYLDNLNLLYVAFTRAELGLIVTAPITYPKKGEAKINSVDKLVLDCIRSDEMLSQHWQEPHYVQGKLVATHDVTPPTGALELAEYTAARWRDKLIIKRSKKITETIHPDQEKRQYGIHVHEVLSRIRYRDEIDEALRRMLLEGLITEDELPLVSSQLITLMQDEQIASWFAPPWDVRTEIPILLPMGDEHRIDRLLLRDKQAVVIDFKTGEKNKKDQQQVLEYMQTLRSMNFIEVKGYVLYLRDYEVISVSERTTRTYKTKDQNQLGLF